MTPERFTALLDAYGADLRRWPEVERAAAQALLAVGPPMLQQQLQNAALLDGWLDASAVPAADDALAARIAAVAAAAQRADAAPRIEPRPARPQRTRRFGSRWWWSGAGLAGVGLAGTLAGVFAASVLLRGAGAAGGTDWAERATAFSDISADWSEE